MPLIDRRDVSDFAKEMAQRNALLWHACQLRDLAAYVALGGVASRSHLTSTGRAFTAFETDGVDVVNNVWDKVFFNFSDFGNCFAAGFQCVPNCYGPIALAFRPKAISIATDLSVTLRSASGHGFDRVAEGLSLADTRRLFEKGKKWVRCSEELESIFGREVQVPEMNCSIPTGFASFDHVAFAVVDPYTIGGEALVDVARRILSALPQAPRLFSRDCRGKRGSQDYMDLWNAVAAGTRRLEDVPPLFPKGGGLANWILGASQSKSVVFQFPRYATYLASGTISAAGQF